MGWIDIETRLVLAAVFLLSGAGKLRSRAAFAEARRAVSVLGGVPERLLSTASGLLAVTELVVALTLMPGPTAMAALTAIVLMLTAFSLALARAIRNGVYVTCACFGAGGRPVSTRQLARNACLVVLAAAAIAARLSWPGDLTSVSVGGLAVAAFGAVVAAGVVALWDDLADLVRPESAPPNQ
jgi:hypothetical protein